MPERFQQEYEQERSGNSELIFSSYSITYTQKHLPELLYEKEIFQNSQENSCTRVSVLIKLQALRHTSMTTKIQMSRV